MCTAERWPQIFGCKVVQKVAAEHQQRPDAAEQYATALLTSKTPAPAQPPALWHMGGGQSTQHKDGHHGRETVQAQAPGFQRMGQLARPCADAVMNGQPYKSGHQQQRAAGE